MPPGHRFSPRQHSPTHRIATNVSPSDASSEISQRAIPKCAQSCLESHVRQDYTCADDDLSCLCSHYSTDAFTLGEYAYVCLQFNCPDFTTQDAYDSYNICAAQPNAVPARHSTITVPAPSATPTVTSSKQTVSATQTATDSSTRTFATTTDLPVTAGQPTPAASSQQTASPTTAADSASSTDTLGGKTSLSSAQAIGISIAALGTVVIIIAAVWLYAYLKRRKGRKLSEKRQSYDFVDDAPSNLTPGKTSHSDVRNSMSDFTFPSIGASNEKRRTEWPRQFHNGSRHLHAGHTHVRPSEARRLGNASVDASRPVSQRSDGSQRTISQLLPEKPTSMPQQRSNSSNATMSSPATVFEEESNPAKPTMPPPGLSMGTMCSQKPPQSKPVHQYQKPSEHLRMPQLALKIPQQAHHVGSITDLGTFAPPSPPPVLKRPETESRMSERSQARNSSTSVLNYYTTAVASPESYVRTPIEDQVQVRRPPPAAITVTKPIYPPQAVRTSSLSDRSNRTSFESTDPDEPTPPEEDDKRLTPVAESPIAALRYPKIPRSSNQAVPRSPAYRSPTAPLFGVDERGALATQSARAYTSREKVPPEYPGRGHTPTLSGSTLAAKRRVDSLASNLERGLRIKHSNHSRTNSQTSSNGPRGQAQQQSKNESPLQQHSRIASTRRQGPDWPLTLHLTPEMQSPANVRSPIWEPKLTPRRDGDDLYLDLSIATPRHTHFHYGP